MSGPGVTFKIRRGLAADWHSVNPVLSLGEPGYETDGRRLKFGTGTDHWDDLDYVAAAWGDVVGDITDQADLQTALGLKLDASAYSAADVLAKLLTVDGSGSSLDADTLDAHDSPYFLARGNHSGTQAWSTLTATPTTLAGYGITDGQPLHANLTAFSGLTLIADRLPYANGTGTLALTTFTAAGRALIDDADATAQRVTLGLVAIASSGSAADLSTGTIPAGRMPALTGDATTVAGAVAVTLATVNSGAGTYGDSSHVAQVTVDAKGRSTTVASVLITPAAISAIALSALDTDTALAANSDAKVPSQKAIKAYVDALLGAQDAMVFKTVIDCSANPNYPAADKGWTYRVSVAGKIGGAPGINVEAGDILLCMTDGTAAGNQATVGANWSIIQTNIDGAVIGPASATDGGFARFDGITGKLLKNSAATVSLTADVSGILPAANGGSGFGTYVVGDILYASTTSAQARLAGVATGNVLISGGVGTAPSWGKADLTAHVSGDLPFANLAQIAGLSVLGVTGGSTADVAGIAGTANQVLRLNSGGTALAFGSINLASSAAVTGTLAVANGGTGTTASTGSGNLVLATSPALTTPSLGVATATSIAVNGGTIGSNALAVAGTSLLTGKLSVATNAGFEFKASSASTDGYGLSQSNTAEWTFSQLQGGMRLRFGGNISFHEISTTASAANAFINASDGNLLRSTSSIRYKRNVETMAPEYADRILDLRPVWYQSRASDDNPGWGYWGFIAEEVAEIDPRLVHWAYRDEDYDARFKERRHLRKGAKLKPEAVQYERAVVALVDVTRRLEGRVTALENERTQA